MSFSFLFSKCVSGDADFSELCSYVYGVAFHPKENILASCSLDKSIKLWNLDTGAELSTMTGHSKRVLSVAFSADGQWVMSGSSDKTIRLWDTHAAAQYGRHVDLSCERRPAGLKAVLI